MSKPLNQPHTKPHNPNKKVPGHDTRDFEFARRFGLDVKRVVAPASSSGSSSGSSDGGGDDDGGLPLTEPGVAVGSSRGGLKIDGMATAEAKGQVRGW